VNAYLYSYKGEPVEVIAQSDKVDLIQIGDRVVLVKKESKKSPKLRLIKKAT